MFTAAQLEGINELLTDPNAVPQPPGTGRLMLTNGRELIGTWNWHMDLKIGHFVDTGGIAWIIDVNEVVAFSPITETPGGELAQSARGSSQGDRQGQPQAVEVQPVRDRYVGAAEGRQAAEEER